MAWKLSPVYAIAIYMPYLILKSGLQPTSQNNSNASNLFMYENILLIKTQSIYKYMLDLRPKISIITFLSNHSSKFVKQFNYIFSLSFLKHTLFNYGKQNDLFYTN